MLVERKECFLLRRRTGSEGIGGRSKGEVQRIVREAKKRTNEEWCASMTGIFKGSSKKIWKGINNEGSEKVLPLRNTMVEELDREEEDEGRWGEYFGQILNGEEEHGGLRERELVIRG